MNIYIFKLKKLLEKFNLDAIVIYANGYEDSAMKAISGTFSILQDHILITKSHVFISTPSYLVSDLKKRTDIPILPAGGENLTIFPIVEKLGKNKRLGVAGFFKFSDVSLLHPSFVMDLNPSISNLIRFKSDEYIKKLSFHTNFTAKIVNDLSLEGELNQLELKNQLNREFLKKEYDLSFPICITSGNDIFASTSLSASNKQILKDDIVCVDVGIKKDIFTTDMTRMFFNGNKKAKRLYEFIKEIHNDIISNFVSSEKRFPEIINEYKKRANENPNIIRVKESDFGHGIGFILHEKPMVEEDKGLIGKNIVFTLEPTFVTKYGLMRIEDMVGILSNGKVLKLT